MSRIPTRQPYPPHNHIGESLAQDRSFIVTQQHKVQVKQTPGRIYNNDHNTVSQARRTTSISAAKTSEPSSRTMSKSKSTTMLSTAADDKLPPRTPRSQTHQPNVARPSTARKTSNPISATTPDLKKAKSSAGLREHIARARAELAKSAQKNALPISPQSIVDDPDDPFSAIKDPFNQAKNRVRIDPGIERAIKKARSDGRLNIANYCLKDIPQAVYKMYQPDPSHVIDFSQDFETKWYDYEDLTVFNAGDNELTDISEDFVDAFAATQVLDLRNNRLQNIPENLMLLSQLTTLTLSGNRLQQDVLDVITQIDTLSMLNLSRNKLSGNLTPKLSNLKNLNELDLSENDLSAIDYSITGCAKLQKLNISANRLTTLKSSQLASLAGLVEVDASRNRISNQFIDSDLSLPRLEVLNLSHNLIPALDTNHRVSLPSLSTLLLLQNRITSESLRSILSSSKQLITLNLEGNLMTSLPREIYGCTILKHLDISNCRLTEIPPQLSHLPLEILIWEGNPARIRGGFGKSTREVMELLSHY